MALEFERSEGAPLPRLSGQGIVGGGAAAGFFAASVTAILAVLRSYSMGLGFFMPFRGLACAWFGVDALVGGTGVVLAGIATHFIASMVWGVLFAAIIRRSAPPAAAFWGGIAFGIGIWGVNSIFLVPALLPALLPRIALAPGWWLTEHVIFGACLVREPELRRRSIARQEARRLVRERLGIEA